jgi:hypothetical protein
MARVRSPNYPQFSLAEAIKRIGPVFEKERQHPMPKEVMAKHLGYGGLNGASLGAISAVHKYGLVELDGESYRVTDRALAILHPHSEAERTEAIKAAALAPALFAELADHFKGAPPSDDNLRAYLVRRGFAQSALTGAIQAFRETISMLSPESLVTTQETTLPGQTGQTQAPSRPAFTPPPPATMAHAVITEQQPGRPEKVLRVALTDDRLEVSAALMDQKSVERLIRILQVNKDLLPAEAPSSDEEIDPTS